MKALNIFLASFPLKPRSERKHVSQPGVSGISVANVGTVSTAVWTAGSVSDAASSVLTNTGPPQRAGLDLTASWASSQALGPKELGHHTADLAQA